MMKTYTFTVPAKEVTFKAPNDPTVLAEVIKQLNIGRKIGAIKAIRHGTELSLKESKEYIESFNTQNGRNFLENIKDNHPEYFL